MISFLKNKKLLNIRFVHFAIILLGITLLSANLKPDWGFFGHRKINRMAVFTLPPPMIAFFKKNIEYLTDHAVDPDKRRYATKHEAVRHYIDIDIWEEYPFDTIPRTFIGALMKYADVSVITAQNDTILLFGKDNLVNDDNDNFEFKKKRKSSFLINKKKYRNFFFKNVMPLYYEEEWKIPCDSLSKYFPDLISNRNCQSILVTDNFSQYGILPYHLVSMQKRLTNAFRSKNKKSILRVSAEMGHYVGDAHVPLHTTENYNGQLTDQIGIHGFWESRIPELLAEKEYDFFVGKAGYIEKPNEYFWGIIEQSHILVDSVLNIEKELSKTFPSDQQYCFEKRNELTVRQPCREYSIAYANRMKGMVEKRMSATILALGSVWYTAWIDAGQPDLMNLNNDTLTKEEEEAKKQLEESFRNNAIKGRAH